MFEGNVSSFPSHVFVACIVFQTRCVNIVCLCVGVGVYFDMCLSEGVRVYFQARFNIGSHSTSCACGLANLCNVGNI